MKIIEINCKFVILFKEILQNKILQSLVKFISLNISKIVIKI